MGSVAESSQFARKSFIYLDMGYLGLIKIFIIMVKINTKKKIK